MKAPNNVDTASPRHYDGLPEIEYPFHDRDALVTNCGRICMHAGQIPLSTIMVGQKRGT